MSRGHHGEFSRIAWLSEQFERHRDRVGQEHGVMLGIGDDAAVLVPPAGKRLVWTVDVQVEGVHFRREILSWEQLGSRSIAVAASDLAAMGATPWCALSSLTLPEDLEETAFRSIILGQQIETARLSAPVVGGNMSRGEAVTITITFLGHCDHVVTRRGASAGDGIWIAGRVGLAALGLRVLTAGLRDPQFAVATMAWTRVRPLIAEGLAMASIAHAGLDVSDGLAQDLNHLAEAGDVRAILDADALLRYADGVSGGALSDGAHFLAEDPLKFILYGGEDYALLAAADQPIPGFTRVGGFVSGKGLGLRRDGREDDLEARGFQHF